MTHQSDGKGEKQPRATLTVEVREALLRLRMRAERLPSVDTVAVIREGRQRKEWRRSLRLRLGRGGIGAH